MPGIGTIVKGRYVENPAGMFQLLVSPSGVVGKKILQLGVALVPIAKSMAPVKTGNLQMSIGMTEFRVGATPGGPGPISEVAVNVSYALDVHRGTPPHEIRAVNKKVLKFPKKGAGPLGPFAYAKVVNHPGTKPNPFFFQALVATIKADRGVKLISVDPG